MKHLWLFVREIGDRPEFPTLFFNLQITTIRKLGLSSIFLIILFAISGCANDMMEIPVSALTSDESRMKAYSVIGDTSTAKEAIVHKSWQTYLEKLAEMQEHVGFTMDYKEITLKDGSKTFLPLVSYRPPLQVHAPPTEPSQHPVWRTVDNVVNRGIMWAGIGWIAHEFRGMQESAYDAAGNTYNGPVNMKGSYNTAGNDQALTMSGAQYGSTGADNQQSGGGAAESEEESEVTEGGRCRDNGSCPAGQVCSRQDGSVGQCIPE